MIIHSESSSLYNTFFSGKYPSSSDNLSSSFLNRKRYESARAALDIYLQALEEPELLTLAEASALVPYSQEYLSLLARKGALGAFKRGRNWYITREALERYVMSIQEKRSRAAE